MPNLRAALISMALSTCLLPACGLAPDDEFGGGAQGPDPDLEAPEVDDPAEGDDWLVGPPVNGEGQALVPGGSPPTQGWRQRPFQFRVQHPYDKKVSDRYSFHPPSEHRLFVLAGDNAHQPNNGTDPRTEMRWREEYTSGQHMFDADVFIVPGANNSSVVQIKRLDAPSGPATAIMLVVHADGHIRYYRNNGSEPVIRNAFSRWFNLKIAHDASSGRIRIFENDRQVAVKLGNKPVNELDDRTADADRGKVRFHFKNGPYGVTSRSEIRYRNVRYWTR